jgi:serine phosphatase RsbU (regulator of sigma subunit)
MGEQLEVQIGAAKVPKYAVAESGDTLEIIERPLGGISAVLVDGQRSGRSARIVSNIVARKAVSLLGEGVRDGAVARAVADYLRTHRAGQVSAELQMVSIDLTTRTLVISRNARCPAHVWRQGALETLAGPCDPIGIYANTRPSIIEIPLASETYAVLSTDGLALALNNAGERNGQRDAVGEWVAMRSPACQPAQELAEELLTEAVEACAGRPRDDISVLVVAVLSNRTRDNVRTLSARFPV